jgi:hypothetical protein
MFLVPCHHPTNGSPLLPSVHSRSAGYAVDPQPCTVLTDIAATASETLTQDVSIAANSVRN